MSTVQRTTEINRRLDAFTHALREQGIHCGVGLGTVPVKCVLCGQPWPCASEQGDRIAKGATVTKIR